MVNHYYILTSNTMMAFNLKKNTVEY